MRKLILPSLLVALSVSCSKSPPGIAADEVSHIRAVSSSHPQPDPPPGGRIWRAWTFVEDGVAGIQAGGFMSFSKGGKLEGDFVRAYGGVAVLKMLDGNNAEVPIASLSDPDREVLRSVAGLIIDERPLDREANWRKARLAATSQALQQQKAREDARAIAQYEADKKAREEAELAEQIRKSQEPPIYFAPAVQYKRTQEQAPRREIPRQRP